MDLTISPLARIRAELGHRYAIARELGAFGFTTVYLARDLTKGGLVAIHVLYPELAGSILSKRFTRELQRVAELEHPNIASLREVGGHDGLLYVVRDYIAGEPLRDLLRRRKQLQLPEAIRISADAARALSYAHAQGVVHGDVRPENIMVGDDGVAKVVSFGLATAMISAERRSLARAGYDLEATAYRPGERTPTGMADTATDVYALACVLHEMLTGAAPHAIQPTRGTNIRTWAVLPGIPEAVADALDRALAVNSSDRLTDAAEFLRAMESVGIEAPVASRPERVRVKARSAAGAVVGSWAWLNHFLVELRRRHVGRIVIAYALATLGITTAAKTVSDTVPDVVPKSVPSVVFMLLVLGFPLAVALAWAFDVTTGGIRRTPPAPTHRPAPSRRRERERKADASPRVSTPGTELSPFPATPTGVGRTFLPTRARETELPPVPTPPTPERVERALVAQLQDELRTPANAVVAYSRMLLSDLAGPGRTTLLRDLDRIRTAGETFRARLEEALNPDRPILSRFADQPDLSFPHIRHELRTPLNAIIGYCELILEEQLDPIRDEAAAADIERILAAGRQALAALDATESSARSAQTSINRAAILARGVLAKLHPVKVDPALFPPKRGTLLVVDDAEANRDLIGHHLARQGYLVCKAASGQEALQILGKQNIDLILLDILMPEMDGVDVLRCLKNDAALSEIPVIVISALDEFDSVIRCIELGAVDFVAKPFDPVLLGARVSTILDVRRLQQNERVYADTLRRQQEWTDRLLTRAFPARFAERIKGGETNVFETAADAAVLAAGVVSNTNWNSGGGQVISRLGELFTRLDAVSEAHGIELIKTSADCYIAVVGWPQGEPGKEHVIGQLALALREETRRFAAPSNANWRLRIGLHAGPVTAGLITSRRLAFDVWGEGVETAYALQLHAAADSIHMSPAVCAILRDRYRTFDRGVIDLPGKGEMRVYVLEGAETPL